MNKNCELTYFRIYDNIDNKVIVDWSKKDIIYNVCNSISLIDEGNNDDIFSKMLRACNNIYNIIDILESDYNELTNIDVYTKYDIKKFINRLYYDTIDLKSLLEDCKEVTYVD